MYQGLFSENHDILPKTASSQLYAGLVVIFMVGTYGLALSLDNILNLLSRLKHYVSSNNRGSDTKDGRIQEHPSGEKSPLTSGDVSDGCVDVSKVSAGRAGGLRGWTSRGKRAGPDPGEPV
jgi:hypothetical protein